MIECIMSDHNIEYDRGEMFYCSKCGLWAKIKLTQYDAGIPGFIVAGRDKHIYENIFIMKTCNDDGDYTCVEREENKKIN